MPLVSRVIYRHAFILESALAALIAEARRYRFKESGGPLAGYVSEDDAVVVTHAAGPGRKGVRGLLGVTISGEHAQAFCDDVWRRSGGLFDYVGDWHSHIGFSVRNSASDVIALREMAVHCSSRPTNPVSPVSLILSRPTLRFAVYAFDDDGMFEEIPCSLLGKVPATGSAP